MMHITGGAYTKLKLLLRNLDAVIDGKLLRPQRIFYMIYNKGVSDEEMYKTFNCGIGFVLGVNKKEVNIVSSLNNVGLEAEIIGEVVKGDSKVRIRSGFSDNNLVF